MICDKCKKVIDDNSKFCSYCGNKITRENKSGNFHKYIIVALLLVIVILGIIIFKDKSKASSSKVANSAAAEKSQTNTIASHDTIKNKLDDLMNRYTKDFSQAVNTNKFSDMEDCLYPGSKLYNDQKKYVTSTYNAGIKENIVSFNITSYTLNDDNKSGTVSTEEVYKIEKNGNTSVNTYKCKYTYKYNEEKAGYQLDSIASADQQSSQNTNANTNSGNTSPDTQKGSSNTSGSSGTAGQAGPAGTAGSAGSSSSISNRSFLQQQLRFAEDNLASMKKQYNDENTMATLKPFIAVQIQKQEQTIAKLKAELGE